MTRKKFFPAISVVIPMYNSEKYIAECLESILAQTFNDYEIIIVDDCSTDKSCIEVEKYLVKFDGKLKLIRRKINSGLPSVPSNIGLKISRGKYIFFMDNDDTITKTAFEELYKIAEDFQADVVACEKYYQFKDDRKTATVESGKNGEFVTAPTLLSNDFEVRVNDVINKKFIWNLWSKLIRRSLLIENEIEFANVTAQDFFFTYCLIFSAKKYVLVPNVINFYRIVDSSLQKQYMTGNVRKIISKWIISLTEGFNYLDNFLSRQNFFQQRADLKYKIFVAFTDDLMNYLFPLYRKISAPQLDEIICEELEKLDKNPSWTAFIFSRMTIYRIKLQALQK